MIGPMSRLTGWLGVRSGEGRLAGLVAAVFAAVEVGRGFGEIGVGTLVLSRFGPAVLPYLFIGLGVASLVVAVAYGAALGRVPRGRLFVALIGGVAALLLIGRVAIAAGEAALPVLWVTVYAAGTLAVTVAWTVAASVFHARQARRLFPICTSAAIAGSFGVSLLSGPVARAIGTESLIVVQAICFLVAAALLGRVVRDAAGAPLRAPAARRSVAAELRAGGAYVLASPLMRLVAVAYVLFAVLGFSIEFPFLVAMSGAFATEADLATALGLLSAAVTATSFAVSLVLANRIYARFGVATAAVALPVVYLGGFGLWLVSFSVATAALVRFVQQVTQRGISNAAWSAFYNVVPNERRAQVMAFNDGVPGQVGTALSGVLLLAAGTILAPDQVFWLGAAAALACTAVVVAIRRAYARSLITTLRAGLAEQVLGGGAGIPALARDAGVAAHLVTALSAPEAAVRATAAELLGRIGAGEAADALIARLDDPDASVRAAAVRAIASLPPRPGDADAFTRRLDDSDPGVRRAAVAATASRNVAALTARASRLGADPSPGVRAETAVALVRAGEEDRPHAILADLLESDSAEDRVCGLEAVGALGGHSPSGRLPGLLHDRSPLVRAAAVRALAATGGREAGDEPTGEDGGATATPLLVAALGDEARGVRLAAATALRDRPSPPPAVLDVLREGSADAQEAAMASLDGHGHTVRDELLDWARGEVARATTMRRQHAALHVAGAAGSPGGTLDFLVFLLGRRREEIERRLLGALAVLGAPEAGGLIRRCLQSGDPETRAQAIEALDSLGDRDLRRSVVTLLEDEPDRATSSADAVLADLATDPDPWIRALALRARMERAAVTWHEIRERGRLDQDPVVRAVIERVDANGGPAMPDTSRTLGDIDRMLFLRRVPLFAGLAPEDLQRLAATATERFYPGGEALMREGDLGHELVVIVDGAVRVVRTEADGTTREVRRYGAGDHIGELAVLRERPRAATVIADEPGVRGLVIGGEGLTAILRERPEAAMAMLATLAERISTQ